MYAKTVIQSQRVRFVLVMIFCSFANIAGASFEEIFLGFQAYGVGFKCSFLWAASDIVMQLIKAKLYDTNFLL